MDACLTVYADAATRERYLPLLAAAGVHVLRERGPNPAMASLKRSGNLVTAFAFPQTRRPPVRPGEVLSENLLEVFQVGRQYARQYAGVVDAWEMVGEPDVGYCTDLPDRLAAYQKALYLGLKAGGRESGRVPLVLMGALALPPGPWFHRAEANGLLEYTDAYNFHFYGHAADLTGVIAAHRRVAAALPLWITECGINAVPPADFLNGPRRELQAEFTRQTAAQAWRAHDVAVFMPFILVNDKIPQTLTLAPDRLLPAWDAYARFAREHPWGDRPIARSPTAPNPIVVQWLPENSTCEPHKVSGSYRFANAPEISGAIRVYNFSSAPVRGRLTLEGLRRIRARSAATDEIVVAPMSVATFAVSFLPPAADGYVREECRLRFVDGSRHASEAVFALEAKPRTEDFDLRPLAIRESGAEPRHPMFAEDVITSRGKHWLGTNGVAVEEIDDAGAARVRLTMDRIETDPQHSRLAIARVRNLPDRGFIRVGLDRRMDRMFAMCVDLLDRKGQRFTIWENFGVDYAHPDTKEVWLNLADFHPYFWGHCTADATLHPRDVEEIQLRLYVAKVNDPRAITLAIATPRDRRSPTLGE